ncbi:MAG: HAD family hydrolase [Acidobacteria bacterium]|nr:HAD family hydrolase [Acidobacteriota bacterium]
MRKNGPGFKSGLKIVTKGGACPLSAFLVDIDNTVIDVKRRDYQSFLDTALEMGVSALNFDEFVEMRLSGASSREIGEVLLSRGGQPEKLETFLFLRHSKLDRPELFQLDTLFPGVRRALARMFETGLPVIAATLRRDSGLLEREFLRLGIRDFFSGILTAGDIEGKADRRYKPEYDCLCYFKGLVLKEALNRFQLTAESTVFISDTEFDIEAGAALGIITAAVETGYGSNEKLREMADVCLPSLAALSGRLVFGV